MTESIGRQYETAIPALSATANIQEAFRIYHYGVPTTVFNPTNTDPAQLEPKSIAYYLTDFQNQIDNITAALSPTAYEKRGNLLVAGDDGPLVLELNPDYPLTFSENGLVLTSNDGEDTGMRWEAPSITATNIANLANKALVNSTVSGGGSVVGTTATQTLTNKTISLEAADNTITGRLASTSGGTPAGVISQYAGSSAPAGYLLCQGQSVSTTTFSDLFAAIGYNYGGSGGSFNLPNLQNRVPVGRGTGTFGSLNATGGAETHTLTVDQMPSHTHIQNSHNHTQNAHNHGASSGSSGSHGHTASTNTAGSHNHGTTGNHTHESFLGTFVGRSTATGINTQSSTTSVINKATTTATSHLHGSDGSHSHTVTVNANGDHSHTVSVDNATATNQAATATNQNTGSGNAHNNLQPYIVVNYIIKT
jgi:microcystin-dependent protein